MPNAQLLHRQLKYRFPTGRPELQKSCCLFESSSLAIYESCVPGCCALESLFHPAVKYLISMFFYLYSAKRQKFCYTVHRILFMLPRRLRYSGMALAWNIMSVQRNFARNADVLLHLHLHHH